MNNAQRLQDEQARKRMHTSSWLRQKTIADFIRAHMAIATDLAELMDYPPSDDVLDMRKAIEAKIRQNFREAFGHDMIAEVVE